MRRLLLLAASLLLAGPLSAGTWTDIQYVADGTQDHRLDIYTPASGGPFNVMVLIPGGAWQTGHKESYESGPKAAFRDEPLSRGWAVAIINYRLAPTARWPRQIHDCKSAVRWLRANAATYNLRTDNYVVGGHSAGGHLSAIMALTNGDAYYEGGIGTTGFLSDVSGAFDAEGPVDLNLTAPFCTLADQNDHMDNWVQLLGCLAVAPLASPLNLVNASGKPIWVSHCDGDCGVPYQEPQAFYNALVTAGVPTTLRLFSGGDHVCASGFASGEWTPFFSFITPYLVP